MEIALAKRTHIRGSRNSLLILLFVPFCAMLSPLPNQSVQGDRARCPLCRTLQESMEKLWMMVYLGSSALYILRQVHADHDSLIVEVTWSSAMLVFKQKPWYNPNSASRTRIIWGFWSQVKHWASRIWNPYRSPTGWGAQQQHVKCRIERPPILRIVS